MSNYPPGVNDNDPHFDLPSAGDDEGLCFLCGHSGSVRNGVCFDGYEPPDMNPGCGCHCVFPSAESVQSAGDYSMYEDQLPPDMPKADYDKWYALSKVDGVRVGPRYPFQSAGERSHE